MVHARATRNPSKASASGIAPPSTRVNILDHPRPRRNRSWLKGVVKKSQENWRDVPRHDACTFRKLSLSFHNEQQAPQDPCRHFHRSGVWYYRMDGSRRSAVGLGGADHGCGSRRMARSRRFTVCTLPRNPSDTRCAMSATSWNGSG
jgi:hypothetical protein